MVSEQPDVLRGLGLLSDAARSTKEFDTLKAGIGEIQQLRAALRLAIPIMERERDWIADAHCIRNPETLEPNLGTMEEDVIDDFNDLQIAIAAAILALKDKRDG